MSDRHVQRLPTMSGVRARITDHEAGIVAAIGVPEGHPWRAKLDSDLHSLLGLPDSVCLCSGLVAGDPDSWWISFVVPDADRGRMLDCLHRWQHEAVRVGSRGRTWEGALAFKLRYCGDHGMSLEFFDHYLTVRPCLCAKGDCSGWRAVETNKRQEG